LHENPLFVKRQKVKKQGKRELIEKSNKQGTFIRVNRK